MGSVSCRLLSSKDLKPVSGIETPLNSDCDNLTKCGGLLHTISKAEDTLRAQRVPRLSKSGSQSGCSIPTLRSQTPVAGQCASRQQHRHNMEIIEIADDTGDEEVISLGSFSGDGESLIVSDGDYFSASSSQLGRDAGDDTFLELDADPAAAAVHEDDLWGYEIPRPRPFPEHGIWSKDVLAPDIESAAALRGVGRREPDWREFLEDKTSNYGSHGGGHAHANGSFQGKVEPVTPLNSIHALIDHKVDCLNDVLSVFPDICQDYVADLYDNGVGEIAEQLVAHILDKVDNGSEYPKAKDKLKTLKRKRETDEDEEAVIKYGSIDRENGSHDYSTLTRSILSGEFVYTPMVFIDSTLRETRNHLFPAYQILEEAERNWNPTRSPYAKIKKPRTSNPYWTPGTVEAALSHDDSTADTMLALRELQAVRRVRKKADDRRQAERQAELDEEENVRRAEADGTVLECGCCFGDYPLNRMVHCDNDEVPHWFCRGCAKQTAETEIGNSKYLIRCMSTDGCSAGFSRDMKTQFLDEKLSTALDRNEQEEMLRLAGIENLASCPFCPFAAEYPPIEQDREFRCQAPDCEKVSCRLCNLASHIPKTCAESAKENGLSVRRQIEEAMSAAIIRTCNKCGTPFIKEEGCNKMTCTRSGCYNVQCYVCSKSCSYDHFNDRSRGGKPGNCPLFESVEERHQEEVKKAEKEALDKVRAEHPEYTEEDLRVRVSENVKKDDERRKVNDPRNLPPLAGVIQRVPPAAVIQHHARGQGHRHRFEAHPIPQLPPALGPWPPAQDPPHWNYDRENPIHSVLGAAGNAEAQDPAVWPREAKRDIQHMDPRPLRMIPEAPVWQGIGVQYPAPAPHGVIPRPYEWQYMPDAGIQFDNAADLMQGYLQPPNAHELGAGANPLDPEDIGRRYQNQYLAVPPGVDIPNDDIFHGKYDGSLPNLGLDRLQELRLRQLDRLHQQALPQRPGRLPRGLPGPQPVGIALRLPRGNTL